MDEIKSLADQLRNKMATPGLEKKVETKNHAPPKPLAILDTIRAYDNSDHKNMVHIRFDEKTVKLMNQFKMATGIDVTKLVAFSISKLFRDHPELKEVIKQFFQKLD